MIKQLRTGILLVNLGTPDAPTPKAVRRYLAEFLSDTRVVEIPKWLWRMILWGVILPFRSRASAKLYQNIWTEHGSPLLVNSSEQAQLLKQQVPEHTVVALGMRYGNPSIESALKTLREQDINKLIVLPLYPQYAAATTGSTFDAVSQIIQKWRWVPEIKFISQYADHPAYINALVDSIQQHWQQHGKSEKLIFSYHGIPKRNLEQGDPYYCYCHKTTRLVTEQLQLQEHEWQMVFQSRFGRAEWLQPYCVEVLKDLPAQGTKNIDIICPGFSSDCLETLEEINMTNKELFLENGGQSYRYIPALNTQPAHIKALAELTL